MIFRCYCLYLNKIHQENYKNYFLVDDTLTQVLLYIFTKPLYWLLINFIMKRYKEIETYNEKMEKQILLKFQL